MVKIHTASNRKHASCIYNIYYYGGQQKVKLSLLYIIQMCIYSCTYERVHVFIDKV